MNERTRRSLILFVDKAQKLQSFGLLEHLRAKGRGFHVQINPDGSSNTKFDLPDEKERDASLLTLRMFIQQNESFSLHKFDTLANDPTISGGFRKKLIQIRKIYFDYLNGYPKKVLPGFFGITMSYTITFSFKTENLP